MGPTPYHYLPLWARVTIERLDSYTEPVRPDEIPPGTLRLVRLTREGVLCAGDLVATRRLGACEVMRVHTQQSMEVKSQSSGQHYLLSELDFGADARIATEQPVSDAP
ncbi:hypothetical protein [Acidovorax sp. SDU_ACID1]|uniref:hypothetical protein n=1 Tax=Acidovorax sp. SDU_ACID1 TaxID=3136632 RepID=UPI00387302A1